MQLRALCAAATLTALPGCLAVAAGGMGVLVSQDFTSQAHVMHYDSAADEVWPQVKRTVTRLAVAPPAIDEVTRTIEARVEDGSTTVRVEAVDNRNCRMLVGGRKLGMHNSGLAAKVMVQIDRDVRK